MQSKLVLFLLFFVPVFINYSCQKSETTEHPKPPTPNHSVEFTVKVCDQNIDVTCQEVSALQIVPGAEIYLYDSQEKRDAGQQEIGFGITTISGIYTFSGLEAGDFFYTAIHPSPNTIEGDGKEKSMVRISPNAFNLKVEILYLKN